MRRAALAVVASCSFHASSGSIAPEAGACGPCAPDGWAPVLYNNRSAGSAETCPAGWQPLAAAPLLASGLVDPGCASCTCGTPSGQSCSAMWVASSAGDITCGRNDCSQTVPGDLSCAELSADCIYNSVKIASITGPTGTGTCAASGGGAMPLGWSSYHDMCEPASPIACDQSECLPASGGTFESAACVAHGGDVSCPSGYPMKQLFETDVMDRRTCSACACAAANGATCAQSIILYACQSCNPSNVLALSTNTCSTTSISCGGGPALRSARYQGVSSPGTCAPSGGVESGQASATGPWTVCCSS